MVGFFFFFLRIYERAHTRHAKWRVEFVRIGAARRSRYRACTTNENARPRVRTIRGTTTRALNHCTTRAGTVSADDPKPDQFRIWSSYVTRPRQRSSKFPKYGRSTAYPREVPSVLDVSRIISAYDTLGRPTVYLARLSAWFDPFFPKTDAFI